MYSIYIFARTFVLAILTILFTFTLNAQTTYQGRVVDGYTGQGLIGAQVALQGFSTSGTITDPSGNFLFSGPQADSLIISYVGYLEQTIFVSSEERNEIHIALTPASTALDQVIVSANRTQQLRSEVPAAIAILSPQLIQESDANTLDQVLNKVPGVFVADLANEQHMTSIRSPISTKGLFLFLEDGLPTRPTGVFQHNALNEMNQAAIQSVEIIRGPASSTYGAEAIGGAINILTANPTPEISGRVALRTNSNGLRRADVRLSNTYGKTGVFLGGYYTQRRDGFFDHSDMNKYAATLKMTRSIDDRTHLTLAGTYANLDTDMTGSLDSTAFFDGDVTSTQTFTERTVQALRLSATLDRQWSQMSRTTARLFYRNNAIGQIPSYRVRTNRQTGLVSGTINERTFNSIGGVVQHRQKLNFWNGEIIAGVSIDNSPTAFFEDYILIDQNEAGINIGYTEVDSTLTNNEIDLFNLGAYATLQLRPIAKLKISASLRYDRFQYEHRNFLPENAFSGSPNSTDNFQAFTPKVGLTYNFTDRIGAYTNFAQGFVPPQVGELYRGVSVPTLEPAIYNNYELGLWYGLRFSKKVSARFDVAAYQIEAENQIISVRLDDGTRENRNAGETRGRGIEYGVNLSYGKELNVRWSGSFAKHEFVNYVERGNDFSGNELAQAPNAQWNWEVIYRPAFLNGFRLALENQRLGTYYMNNDNSKTYEGFSLFNIRSAYSWRQLELRFTLLNLTDELWSPRADASRFGDRFTLGIPRTYQFGLAYNIAPAKRNRK